MIRGCFTNDPVDGGAGRFSSQLRDEPVESSGVSGRYTIMVTATHAASYSCLLPPAIKAAQAKDGHIILADLVVVPDQLPLLDGARFVPESQSVAADALAVVEERGIPVTTVTLVTHRAIQAVAEAVLERQVNLLLVSGQHRSTNVQADIGTFVHRLLAKVNCDVLFLSKNGKPPFQRLLLPIADPERTKALLEAAWLLTDEKHALIEVFHISPGGTESSRQQSVTDGIRDQIDSFRNRGKDNHLEIRFKGTEDQAPFEAILQEARDFDCVLIGISHQGWLKRKLRGSTLARLIETLNCPVAAMRTERTARFSHNPNSRNDAQK